MPLSSKLSKEELDDLLSKADAVIEQRDDGSPVRKIFNGRRHMPVGLVPSVKSRRMVAWESRLERKAIRWFEVDETVVSYREQPHTLSFKLDGRKVRYTPDFEVEQEDGVTRIVECKYRDDMRTFDPPYRAKIHQARRLYRSVGINFQIVSDMRFRVFPVWHNNARVVEKTRRLCPGPFELAALIHHLEARAESTLRECGLVLAGLDQAEDRVLALIARRIISVDLTRPLNGQTRVQLKAGYETRLSAMPSVQEAA
jgi:hypothetical protein